MGHMAITTPYGVAGRPVTNTSHSLRLCKM